MKQIFGKIGRGLGEYFLATETRKFFKERGGKYTIETIFGKYIPNILDLGIISASAYFHEPRILQLLAAPETLRLMVMADIPEKKERLENRIFYNQLPILSGDLILASRQCSNSLERASNAVRETTEELKKYSLNSHIQ